MLAHVYGKDARCSLRYCEDIHKFFLAQPAVLAHNLVLYHRHHSIATAYGCYPYLEEYPKELPRLHIYLWAKYVLLGRRPLLPRCGV